MVDIPEFDETTLAKLAREMTMNVKNVYVLFEEYGINEEIYYELYAKNEFFRRIKDQYTKEWNSTLTTKERVQVGSLSYIEQLLPVGTKRALHDPKEPLASVTGWTTLLTKCAGIGDNKIGVNPTERFVITINLGDETETYNKAIDVTPDADSELPKLPQLSATSRNSPQLPANLSAEDQEFMAAFEEIDNGQADSKGTTEPPIIELRSPGEG